MREFYESEHLNKEEEIIDYFTEFGDEFFVCGHGYYEESTSVICKVNGSYYKVSLEAELSVHEFIGEPIYNVDHITSATFEKLENISFNKNKHK